MSDTPAKALPVRIPADMVARIDALKDPLHPQGGVRPAPAAAGAEGRGAQGQAMTPRRSYGTGSLTEGQRTDGGRVYIAKFPRNYHGRQVKRRVGPVRTPHQPDGLTKRQAEVRLGS